MLQKPTPEAAKVIRYSEAVARHNGSMFINTRHILLSMIINGDRAQEVLAEIRPNKHGKKGIDQFKLKENVERRLSSLSEKPLNKEQKISYVPRAYNLLGKAIETSIYLGMAQEGSESILLAMLNDGSSFAKQDLAAAGVTYSEAIRAVLDLYGPKGSPRP